MGTQQGNSGGDASTTSSIGHRTSGEAGSTPTHETMAETGGSGTQQDDVATASGSDSNSGSTSGSVESERALDSQTGGVEGAGSDATTTARGFQDTRGEQAGRLPDGLGTPETGGNQNQDDMAPARGE